MVRSRVDNSRKLRGLVGPKEVYEESELKFWGWTEPKGREGTNDEETEGRSREV